MGWIPQFNNEAPSTFNAMDAMRGIIDLILVKKQSINHLNYVGLAGAVPDLINKIM